MKGMVTALCLAAALAGCRGSRSAAVEESVAEAGRVVRMVSADSARVVAVVELDAPRLTLRSDSGLRLEAASGRAHVLAERTARSAVEAADSMATSSRQSRTELQAEAARPRVWPVVAALLLIALSWTGIRSRR